MELQKLGDKYINTGAGNITGFIDYPEPELNHIEIYGADPANPFTIVSGREAAALRLWLGQQVTEDLLENLERAEAIKKFNTEKNRIWAEVLVINPEGLQGRDLDYILEGMLDEQVVSDLSEINGLAVIQFLDQTAKDGM